MLQSVNVGPSSSLITDLTIQWSQCRKYKIRSPKKAVKGNVFMAIEGFSPGEVSKNAFYSTPRLNAHLTFAVQGEPYWKG